MLCVSCLVTFTKIDWRAIAQRKTTEVQTHIISLLRQTWPLRAAKERQVQIVGFENLHMDTGVCVCVFFFFFFTRPGRASGDATATFSGSVCHQPIHQHFSLSSLSASKLPSDSPPIHPFIPRYLPRSLYSRLKFAKVSARCFTLSSFSPERMSSD